MFAARIFALVWLMVACGSEREVVVKDPQPAPPASGGGLGVSFAEIQPLLKTYCSRCHVNAQFLVSEAAYRASSAAQRVASSNMPQPSSQEARSLSQVDRAKILSFK